MNIVKSNKNQIANARNGFQGRARKVLCVCQAGLLRSPTLASTLIRAYGFNTRAVGASASFALIPISEALLEWADEVVFVDFESWSTLSPDEQALVREKVDSVTILNIPDDFDFGDALLEEVCLNQYSEQRACSSIG